MRKIIVAALILTMTSSNAFAWGYGSGYNYGPGGGCWNCGGNFWRQSGPIALGVVAGAAVVGGIVNGLFRRPPPPPVAVAVPPGATVGNAVPGCIQQQVMEPSGRIGINVICP